MDKYYLEKRIPELNNLQIWILLADIYFRVETNENEEYILSQLEVAEMLEIELNRRNEGC